MGGEQRFVGARPGPRGLGTEGQMSAVRASDEQQVLALRPDPSSPAGRRRVWSETN